jgi:hypothetical protein
MSEQAELPFALVAAEIPLWRWRLVRPLMQRFRLILLPARVARQAQTVPLPPSPLAHMILTDWLQQHGGARTLPPHVPLAQCCADRSRAQSPQEAEAILAKRILLTIPHCTMFTTRAEATRIHLEYRVGCSITTTPQHRGEIARRGFQSLASICAQLAEAFLVEVLALELTVIIHGEYKTGWVGRMMCQL